MSGTEQVFGARALPLQAMLACHLRGAELAWAIAFIAPYPAVFLAFVVYPIGFAWWMAARPGRAVFRAAPAHRREPHHRTGPRSIGDHQALL